MVWVNYDLLEQPPNAYANFRYQVFTDAFGNSFEPYVGGDGVPRIGPGIDLSTYLYEVTSTIIGGHPDNRLIDRLTDVVTKGYSGGEDGLLRDRLDEVLREWGLENELPDFPRRFEFSGNGQAREALAAAMQQIEGNLEGWGDVGMPLSEERAVVASLAFQGYDIDEIMSDILFDGDRAGAWLKIRYLDDSEGGPPRADAARRYYQSARFELYNNPRNVDFEEAYDVGVAYSEARGDILSYEKRYDPEKLGLGDRSLGGRDGIAEILQPAIRAVAETYEVQVRHADELLFVFDGGSARFRGDHPSDDFNSRKNDDDLIVSASTVSANESILGGAGDDVIVSLAGRDRISGNEGDDDLHGGEGNDVLDGGAGRDRLWGGGGADTLKGGKGDDIYYLGGNGERDPDEPDGNPSLVGRSSSDEIIESRHGGNDTAVLKIDSGTIDFRHVENFRLTAKAGGQLTVHLNEFDSFRLSEGDDDLTLVINRLDRSPIDIRTGGGEDTVHIRFEQGVDPSQVLDGKGLTARFRFSDLSANDTIDLTSIGIREIVMKHDEINVDKGFYLLAPGAKLDLMDGDRVEKTYNNYTDHWFVVKCGDDTPFGPEFFGDVQRSHFDI